MKTKSPPSEIIMRNCRTDFYGDEILAEVHKFDDTYFSSVREGGFTAIWLRGQIRDLVTFAVAPHWDHQNAERMAALRNIVARGREHGVGVYLYVNEPKGFTKGDPIFDTYPDLKGPLDPLLSHTVSAPEGVAYAFCTQCTFTEEYLAGGMEQIFSQCSDLAGVITITASEILSHCFSNVDERNLLNEEFKYREVACPRCRESSSIETVIDVMEKIHKGVRAASATARVVAWNWSWGMYEESPQKQIISGLPKDVTIMCDMQRGGSKTVDGIPMVVDEYSFSYLGPSPLFIETLKLTQSDERELWAKIMLNVTHEFLMVPYLPLPFRLAKKVIAVRDLGSRGLMGCWNYGGDTTTWMARLGSRIFRDERFGVSSIDTEVKRCAVAVYGEKRADAAYEAWSEFDRAFEYFSFDLRLIYFGPHMHGPGFEWVFTREEIPMPWYFMKGAGRRGTKLSDCCDQLSPEQIIHLLDKLCERWKTGVEILARAFGVEEALGVIPDFEKLAQLPGFEDFNIARTVYIHYQSTVAFFRFRLATLAWFDEQPDRDQLRQEIKELLAGEKTRILASRQIIARYPDFPFQQEAQCLLYTGEDLDGRLENIQAFRFEEGQCL